MSNKVFFFALFIFYTLISTAQTYCSGGIPLSNNLGLSTLEKGSIQLGIQL